MSMYRYMVVPASSAIPALQTGIISSSALRLSALERKRKIVSHAIFSGPRGLKSPFKYLAYQFLVVAIATRPKRIGQVLKKAASTG